MTAATPATASDRPQLWCVLWQAIETGLYRVWTRNDGTQAVAATLAEAESHLAEAAATIARQSRCSNLAAVDLRLCYCGPNTLRNA